MNEIRRIKETSLYSRAVVKGGLVFLMGHVSYDKHVDARTQTRQILARIDETLALAGSDKSKLLSATILLADTADYGVVNEVWAEWIPPDALPARSACGAQLISDGRKVVISGIASL